MNAPPRNGYFLVGALIIGILLFANSSIAQKQKTWSRGFTWVVSKSTSAFRFMLANVKQEEQRLTGRFSYENYVLGNENREAVVIEGVRMSDHEFWPDVTLAVKKFNKDDWEPIKCSRVTGAKGQVIVAPERVNRDLVVSLEPFKPLIGIYEFGRVQISTGETAQFQLNDLKPRGD